MSHDERETELAHTITTTPAVIPWMIFRKIEVVLDKVVEVGRECR